MDSFGILFDSPKGYAPGQTVTGRVVLHTSVPISARYLKICIHGAAHTKWQESNSNNEIKHYSAEINYVSGETLAWVATNGNPNMPSGHHVFPFSFPLPIECPPSYSGFHGHIRYSVRVELDRPWKFNMKEREYFDVIPPIDLNYFPYGNASMVQNDSKDIGAIFKKGVVSITVSIPKQAYAIGEYLPITIDIDNKSKRPATCVRAELHQHSHYRANRNPSLFCTHTSTHEHHKEDSKRVMESRKNIKVAAGCQGREELRMRIPKVPPSFECPIIGVQYCLSVKIDTETSMNNTLHCEFPLIIGTVPVNNSISEGTVPSFNPVLPSDPSMIPVFPTAPSMIPVFPSASSRASVFPSAPPQVERTDSMPPAYDSVESNAGPSALPPSYDESMSVTKI